MKKEILHRYLYFTKRERIAVLFLTFLILLFFLLPRWFPDRSGTGFGPGEEDSLLKKQVLLVSPGHPVAHSTDSLSKRGRDSKDSGNRYVYYRYPYVQNIGTGRQNNKAPANRLKPPVILLNTTDSAGLLPLPGIGPVLAGRIISFREKLGGFYSVEQVRETYGLPDSTFQRIKSLLRVDSTHIRQIDLNRADASELARHPYIRWELARLILAYRRQHHGFRELNDLLKISVLSRDQFNRIASYCTVNPLPENIN